MENPVQELIVGNISGATGVEACYEVEMTETVEGSVVNMKLNVELSLHKERMKKMRK